MFEGYYSNFSCMLDMLIKVIFSVKVYFVGFSVKKNIFDYIKTESCHLLYWMHVRRTIIAKYR